eukprot:CAMPEP_0202497368 /NCGR_PEP_ID=MMETSP1361-20130828/22606_1 /ASSEMBLY_ACC=CAM_ASM_000849 /TAXON_ID=210615 /ORGANISM="Staurosira complex sp., Strain CCMP2646" /LENGTH=236 /DNA_ID=CAMNT_0049128951 /DNA_START=258 /DNA_END=966 /DNA_ORIENTATION=+
MKGDKPLYFLTEMCEVHKLNKTGTKETQAKRLVEHYFKHPDDVPDYLQDMIPNGEWKKAAQKDRHVVEVVDAVVDSLEDENDDDLGSVDSDSEDIAPPPPKGTLGIREFPNEMLAACFFAKKRSVYPKTKTFWFCNHEFTTSFVDDALAMVNTTPWNQQPIVQHQEVLCRRTATCPLRLFVMLIAHDPFWARLVNESSARPDRADLDANAVGGNSDFWTDVYRATAPFDRQTLEII